MTPTDLKLASLNARYDQLYQSIADLRDIANGVMDRVTELKGAQTVHRGRIDGLDTRVTALEERCRPTEPTQPDKTRCASADTGAERARLTGTEPSDAQLGTSATPPSKELGTSTAPAQIALLLGKLREAVDTYSCSAMTCDDVRHVGAAIRALLDSHPEAAWEELVRELRRERDAAYRYLDAVSGALADASTVAVPDNDAKLGDAVRALTKERDAATAALATVRAVTIEECAQRCDAQARDFATHVTAWSALTDLSSAIRALGRAARTGAGS